jgi:hypothetical protein
MNHSSVFPYNIRYHMDHNDNLQDEITNRVQVLHREVHGMVCPHNDKTKEGEIIS